MPDPKKKLTDLQRNWNIAKSYLKNGPDIRNILSALKYILDGPSKYQTGQPDILPGFQAKTLLRGNPLEGQLSKTGTISTNAIKALANKSREFEGKLMQQVLDNKFPAQRVVNYDDYRRAVQQQLIPYQTRQSSKYADYGIERLGYNSKLSPETVRLNPQTGQYESVAVKPVTFTFETQKIPLGNAKHYERSTLGHTRTFTDPQNPGTLNILETQSDWAQNPVGGYEKATKSASHHISQLRKMIAQSKERNIPTQNIEERIPLQQQYIDVPSWHIKHLQSEYLPRQLQENMLYASKNGYSKMRYPTSQTVAKIEGYEPILLFGDVNKEQQAIRLQQRIFQLQQAPFRRRELQRALQEYEQLKKESIGQTYSPQEQTILKKYDEFPRMFGKLFKEQKPQIVKDTKGNNWFEFNIPKNIEQMELTYKLGGIL